MSLKKCPECKKEISSYAETCPHCGYRLIQPAAPQIIEDEHRQKQYVTIFAGILSLILGIVSLALTPLMKESNESPTFFIVIGVVGIIGGIIGIFSAIHELNKY